MGLAAATAAATVEGRAQHVDAGDRARAWQQGSRGAAAEWRCQRRPPPHLGFARQAASGQLGTQLSAAAIRPNPRAAPDPWHAAAGSPFSSQQPDVNLSVCD